MFQWLNKLFTDAPKQGAPNAPSSAPEPARVPMPTPAAPSAPAAPAAPASAATAAPTNASVGTAAGGLPPMVAPGLGPNAPNRAAAPMPTAAAAPSAALSFDQRDSLNTIYYNWLFGSEGACELETSEPENQVLEAVTAIVNSQQSGAALVRRMPGLIPQLLQSLRSDNFSGAQLSRTISSDLVLVAAVIRLANSSTLSYGTRITSVENAIMLIGTEGLRHLITSVAFRPIIDMHSGQYTRALAPRIWDQSERCAVANRMLAEEMGVDPFEAFLAGLVQYVGLIVTLRIMDQVDKDGKQQLGSEMFCARLLRDARALSCSIGREWNFPDSVVIAITEQAGARKGVQISPMGRLLSQSDYLSKLRILSENGLADNGEAALFTGLSPGAMACYHRLDAIADDDLPALAAQPVSLPVP